MWSICHLPWLSQDIPGLKSLSKYSLSSLGEQPTREKVLENFLASCFFTALMTLPLNLKARRYIILVSRWDSSSFIDLWAVVVGFLLGDIPFIKNKRPWIRQ
jgi:hypothetical protein